MQFSFTQRLILAIARRLERRKPWHTRGKWLGILCLLATRIRLRTWNLVDTDGLPTADKPQAPPPQLTERQRRARDADGLFNDLSRPTMGAVRARFGRNVPLQRCVPDLANLSEPNPRVVSEQLLARNGEFQPVPFLNLLAAAWLQFMVHDWFSHGSNQRKNPLEFDVPPEGNWHAPSMTIRRTTPDPTRLEDGGPPTYRNAGSHWWDGSQIYGNSVEQLNALRSHSDGKMLLGEGDLLPLETKPHGEVDLTGINDNWWIGLSIMHTLFVREHNQICEMLKQTDRAKRENWDDDRLFDQARLVNAALMAKIHTVEWTPAILPNKITDHALRANWWGLTGSKRGSRLLRRFSRRDLLSGIPGSTAHHHAAPYSLTEEFVAVYRMHPLLPDEIRFRDLKDDRDVARHSFLDVTENRVRPVLESVGLANAVYSFACEHPGMLCLGNFPDSLRDFTRPNGSRIDLAAVDVLRDRERGVPRYNEFRELVGLPRVADFEELLGPVPPIGEARVRYERYLPRLKKIYENDINRVDLLIGLYAEPLVDGFGFSETAFFIFILMASRRLKSDRFLTDDYRPEVYTQEGIRWIEDSSMVDVIVRNVPEVASRVAGVKNAFNPWKE